MGGVLGERVGPACPNAARDMPDKRVMTALGFATHGDCGANPLLHKHLVSSLGGCNHVSVLCTSLHNLEVLHCVGYCLVCCTLSELDLLLGSGR